MTRLTEHDVRTLTASLEQFEARLEQASGLMLRDIATRTAADEPVCVPLFGARIAAVPLTAGKGVIGGFTTCVVAVLRHLGCDAWETEQADVRGIQEAAYDGARVLFLADDHRFVALSLTDGRCIDDDPATADGYVAALEAAADGLQGREVVLLGLGPVGRAAARRLIVAGARVLAVEPDAERLSTALSAGLRLEPVSLADGLARSELVVDASPAADLIDASAVTPGMLAAVPGIPSAFTAAARDALGVRHIHEPLAIGVTVMAARALA
jgi:pyrrolysine biosynthesis protein PylD